jgi:hypothetical protein
MQHGPDGSVLDVGRRSRTVPAPIRRALVARDPHCRFPGCASRHCDAHHLVHWADGGDTSIANLLLLCRRHHRAVHEGHILVVRQPDDGAAFVHPDGRPIPFGPELPATPHGRADHAASEDAAEAPPTWDGTRFDLDWILGMVYRPAQESDSDVPAMPWGADSR